MTETKLYQKFIKPLLLKRGGYFERVEYADHPDIYTCKNRKVLWIELKVVNKRTDIIKPDWRIGQLPWVHKHQKYGGDIILLCLWYVNKFYFLPPREEYNESELEKLNYKEI